MNEPVSTAKTQQAEPDSRSVLSLLLLPLGLLFVASAVVLLLWHTADSRRDDRLAGAVLRDAELWMSDVASLATEYGFALEQMNLAAGVTPEHAPSESWDALIRGLRRDGRYPALGSLRLLAVNPGAGHAAVVRRSGRLESSLSPAPEIPSDESSERIVAGEVPDDHALATSAIREFESAEAPVVATAWRTAGRSGQPVLSQPQPGSAASDVQAILSVPLYSVDSPWTARDREVHFNGLLEASLNLSVLASSIDPWIDDRYHIRISVGGVDVQDQLDPDRSVSSLNRRFERRVLGQTWEFEIVPDAAFFAQSGEQGPEWLLRLGLLLSVLTSTVAAYGAIRLAVAKSVSATESARLGNALAAIEKENAELQSFACVLSHDLKAPLLGIRGLVGLIEEDLASRLTDSAEDREIQDDFHRLDEKIERAVSLIDGVHEYSTTGTNPDQLENIDTADSVRNVAQVLSVDDDRLVLEGAFPRIETYRTRFEQTLSNLIGNAFKYHPDPENARVVVSARPFGDYYLFSVADNGSGIATQDQERVFLVFETIPKNGGSGSGVGLSIVKNAVEELGGSISLDSTQGEGATFYFLWPRVITPPAVAA